MQKVIMSPIKILVLIVQTKKLILKRYSQKLKLLYIYYPLSTASPHPSIYSPRYSPPAHPSSVPAVNVSAFLKQNKAKCLCGCLLKDSLASSLLHLKQCDWYPWWVAPVGITCVFLLLKQSTFFPLVSKSSFKASQCLTPASFSIFVVHLFEYRSLQGTGKPIDFPRIDWNNCLTFR